MTGQEKCDILIQVTV